MADASAQGGAPRVVVLGSAGTGRTKRVRELALASGLPLLTTGGLVRREIATGTDLGLSFVAMSEAGERVPEAMILAMVQNRLDEDDCAGGFFLDGFPRLPEQAAELGVWLGRRGTPLTRVLLVELTEDQAQQCAAGRRYCPMDGSEYHTVDSPPSHEGLCDECGTELVRRAVDELDAVAAQFSAHTAVLEPLAALYRNQGILRRVSGAGSADEVLGRLRLAMEP